MSHSSDNQVHCTYHCCAAKHPSGKWGTIRAAEKGWFHGRDGNAWCPLHIPKWVKKWRER